MNIVEIQPRSEQVRVPELKSHDIPEELRQWYENQMNTNRAPQAEALLDLYRNFSNHLLSPSGITLPETILAINKPPFTTTTGDKYMMDVNDIVRLATGNPQFHAIHRLDRDTSGVLLFGSTKNTRRALHKRFEQRQVSKTYLAVLKGNVPIELAGVIAPLGDSEEEPQLSQVIFSEKSKKAATAFTTLAIGQNQETDETFSVMKINLLSGRRHQIRAHSSQVLQNPLIGDHQYDHLATGADRQLLHAYSLGISLNPGMEKEVPFQFTAPIPDDFYTFLTDKKILLSTPDFEKIFYCGDNPPPKPQALHIPDPLIA